MPPDPAEDVDPEFLGFGAFETTAFIGAILVALFSFIQNPQGKQSPNDKSEYLVYAGWRSAVLLLIVQFIIMVAVLAAQVAAGIPFRPIAWLLLLMFAPWAPLAGAAANTITARRRVSAMMRSRLSRNELSAILRDRFKFGQRRLAIPLIIHHRHPYYPFPIHPSATLARHSVLCKYLPQLREQAAIAATGDSHSIPNALDLGTLWAVDQGPQPAPYPAWLLHIPESLREFARRFASCFSIALLWTTRGDIELACLPYPEYEVPFDKLADQAAVLDQVDELVEGATLGDQHMRKIRRRFCAKCSMALRSAVEAFMESSYKSHSDMRAHVYLRHVGIAWRGSFEKVIDEMWEAAFMGETRGERVYSLDDDLSDSYGDRSKVTTTKMQGLLFMIARSLLGGFSDDARPVMEAVAEVVSEGLNSEAWWADYWQRVARLMGVNEDDLPADHAKVDERVRALYKRALRDSVDDDMRRIVGLLVDSPINGSLCANEACELRHRTTFIPQRFDKNISN